ncbi:hypothetical protein DFH08DRAFT_1007582, partial [Mycena albidolilacea]
SKHEEAIRLGATEFYATKGVESLEIAKLDHLLVTTSFIPDWKPFLTVMKPKSTVYPLTIRFTDLVIPMISIVLLSIKIQGTVMAARSVQKRMLDFAARIHIRPVIEKFPLTKNGVEEGCLLRGHGATARRYRGVLVA